MSVPASDMAMTEGAPRRAAAAAPYLEVRDVGKQFGSFVALHRVNLTVQPGEFVTFLGPSGCGKTTLLRAIAGLDPPTTGRILQGGRDITHLPPSQRDFGIVFQSYALFPNLTVAQNIAYGLRGPAWPKVRVKDRVSELLELIGLAEHSPKYPAQLSGGQQQRVALARALANEPGLLLLDEPLSALDAIVRQHLRQEIRSLQQRLGVTTIMVTHDQEEALGVSDRIVVMSRGKIEQVGTPADIYDWPASMFVASFVGHSSRIEAVVDTPPGHVVAHGVRLAAGAARPMLYGSRVVCFIRPEHVRLHRQDAAPQGALPAAITGVEFLGPAVRLSLEAGKLRLAATITPAELAALEAMSGGAVCVRLPSEHLLVFPDDV